MMASNPTARRIGIVGGSFDPIHTGHLIIAQDAVELLDLSEVIFIPAATPPHKQHVQRVPAEHRLNMLNLAVEGDEHFTVSDLEIQRSGVSYTIDTVRQLRKTYGTDILFLIIGSDTLVDLHNWYKIEELLSFCEVASFLRPGEDSMESIVEKMQIGEPHREKLLQNVIKSRRIEISSTEIRMRLEEGMSIRYLVPPAVETYIHEQGLYQGSKG